MKHRKINSTLLMRVLTSLFLLTIFASVSCVGPKGMGVDLRVYEEGEIQVEPMGQRPSNDTIEK